MINVTRSDNTILVMIDNVSININENDAKKLIEGVNRELYGRNETAKKDINSKTLKEVVRIPDVAKYLHCSSYTVGDLVRRGELPHFRIGNRILFNKESILEWIEEKERQSTIKRVESPPLYRTLKKAKP